MLGSTLSAFIRSWKNVPERRCNTAVFRINGSQSRPFLVNSHRPKRYAIRLKIVQGRREPTRHRHRRRFRNPHANKGQRGEPNYCYKGTRARRDKAKYNRERLTSFSLSHSSLYPEPRIKVTSPKKEQGVPKGAEFVYTCNADLDFRASQEVDARSPRPFALQKSNLWSRWSTSFTVCVCFIVGNSISWHFRANGGVRACTQL